MSSSRPAFPRVRREALVGKLRELPQHGRPIDLRRRHACEICRRDTGKLAWLICLGAVSCRDAKCAVVMPGEVSKHFPTPYGRALDRATLAVFAKTVKLPGQKIAVVRHEVAERAEQLAEAYERLIRWMRAYDAWEWHTDSSGYEAGRVRLIPPKRLEDVLVLRARRSFLARDPVQGLPLETAALLRRVYREGEDVLEIPF